MVLEVDGAAHKLFRRTLMVLITARDELTSYSLLKITMSTLTPDEMTEKQMNHEPETRTKSLPAVSKFPETQFIKDNAEGEKPFDVENLESHYGREKTRPVDYINID